MNTTIYEAPEALREGGWTFDRPVVINLQQVVFFKHPDHPKKCLKWYPEKNGFMVSTKSKTSNAYLGISGCIVPFKPASELPRVLEQLVNDI